MPAEPTNRDIRDYPTQTKRQLYFSLTWIVYDLACAYDQIGFLRSQELETKKETWNADPQASIQTRDRTASYAASHITTEIYKLEASIQRLNQERMLVERLLDDTN